MYANIGRSRRVNYGGDESPGTWDPWGFTSPGAAHAMAFRRHMELYGTTTRQLAEVSVSIRYHACLNPDAVMRNPITIEDHESARYIAAPLRLLDYCLINDGAVCLILTSKERARDFAKPPVLISGFGAQETFSPSSIANFDMDFWYPAISAAGKQAYQMAGVTHEDVDALMCYDNFSPTVLFSLEGLGFCRRGESGAFVENGALSLGGRLPVNTDGGHLSNSYMQGWALNVEAVRQLRGNAAPGRSRIARSCSMCRRRLARGPSSTRAAEGEHPMSYNKPLPRVDTLNKPFWAAAKQGRFMLHHCPACGDTRFPPGPVCPKCMAGEQTWIEASGRGRWSPGSICIGHIGMGSRMICRTGYVWCGWRKGRWWSTTWSTGLTICG